MTRLRILNLPPSADEERPFAVVIDGIGDGETAEQLMDDVSSTGDFAKRLGARCILAFTDPIDLEGDTPPDPRTPDMLAAVRDTLGIDTTQGPADVAGWLLAACGELRVARNDRDGLRERIDWMRASLREALALPDDAAVDLASAARYLLAEARSWARHGYEIGQRHCGWTDHGTAPAWLTDGWPPHVEACEHSARAVEYDTALTRVRGLPDEPNQGAHESDSDYAFGYRAAMAAAKRAARTDQEGQ